MREHVITQIRNLLELDEAKRKADISAYGIRKRALEKQCKRLGAKMRIKHKKVGKGANKKTRKLYKQCKAALSQLRKRYKIKTKHGPKVD
jgi:CTP synthase (UTP-ammonia lyase)